MKKFFVSLAIITGIIKSYNGILPVFADDSNIQQKPISIQKDRNQIFHNKYWLQLKQSWQNLSKSLNMEFEQANKTITKAENNYKKSIEELRKSALIDSGEFEYLNRVFANRIQHIKGTAGLYMCYFSGGIPDVRKSYDGLEKSYQHLQKLHTEGKISTQAYKQAKDNLYKQLLEHHKIQKQYNKTSNSPPDKAYVHLLTELNK